MFVLQLRTLFSAFRVKRTLYSVAFYLFFGFQTNGNKIFPATSKSKRNLNSQRQTIMIDKRAKRHFIKLANQQTCCNSGDSLVSIRYCSKKDKLGLSKERETWVKEKSSMAWRWWIEKRPHGRTICYMKGLYYYASNYSSLVSQTGF
jgi:hypothetical protein